MPSIDITSPGGVFTPAAVGDTQQLTSTFTIASGTNSLVCTGATPFVSGDTGKSFILAGAGSSGGYLNGTMTFVSSSHVTLSVNASTALVAQSEQLTWGTDDAPAFRAFNTWAQAQTSAISATLGAGTKKFLFNSGDSNGERGNSPVWNVLQPITISGNGPSSTSFISGNVAGYFLGTQSNIQSGNGNYGSSSIWTARLASVFAGSSQVTCKNISDAAQFTANTWSLITGIDLFGASGTPPDPFYFEYVFITNVNTGTGVITFQSPLVNTYLSTWPNFGTGTPGFHPDPGGPATLYVIDPAWALNFTYSGIAFDQTINGNQTGANGLTGAFTNCKWSDPFGVTPSVNGTLTFTGCDLSSFTMEYDKLVSNCIFDNTSAALNFQSSDNLVTIRNGSNILLMSGTPRQLVVDSSTVNNFEVGTKGFGKTDTISVSNTAFTGGFSYVPVQDNGDITGNFQADYSMTGGVIKIPKAGLPYGVRWGIPGTWMYWNGPLGKFGQSFQVLGVTDDPSFAYVQTNLSGGFPSYATGVTVRAANTNTFTTSTGLPQVDNYINAATAGYQGSYSERFMTTTLNGATMGFNGTGDTGSFPDLVNGRLISMTVNVTTPYTGAQSFLTWSMTQFDQNKVYLPNGTQSAWSPVINLKTAGLRTITPAGVTGTKSGDSGLTLPDPNSWLANVSTLPCGSTNIIAEYNGNPAVGPVFTVTIITDQGSSSLGVAPLSLRLHS